ncbi:MAG: ATP-binding protein [Bacteroidetes bacterium]|nr:ATP-binding protein [Bacteroidota bacterium]
MLESAPICPYTGLRSFTEEESLYFKGREEHIEHATEQLQRNKFLMLTGASGDGKSSLVYAGIIPNARAGFLKSKFSRWCVADFRPERSPFANLGRAVARQLDISNPSIAESELQHGFSALVDLYRSSNRYLDTDSVAWQQAGDQERNSMKRDAANLIILVDQFEEFFTNPENYHNGVPSKDSNLVLNLLLETARIALEENLPIYVVFTMRSDFIGQCAAFRGLPEYIGFSQFFVPRLNRQQLQQVIEEPAELSGNRITRRLTERLIHDITDGVDQLPILQHALNQIWHAADNGRQEMDLLHYGMVGGMPAHELPDEQVAAFQKWFNAQPSSIQTFYKEPNLQNVLDTHTNKLFEQAADYFQSKTGKTISQEDAKAIIKNAFTCLTKIDQSRAVRNRMTLEEITQILGRAEFNSETVGGVLNIFREPGNTFIRPFITDDPETIKLKPGQVLDITHESLIRNWEYLEKWAKEEFDSYSVSLDFGQQLNRWVRSGKSNAHLFSIGPLTYFENWFNKAKPNTWWIARYLPEDVDQAEKLKRANVILSDAHEFLLRSARKHVVTRTIMKYGAKRIAAVLAVAIIITLGAISVRNYLLHQNDAVLKNIMARTLSIANNPKATYSDRVSLLCEELRMGQTTVDNILEQIKDPSEKLHISMGIASMLIFQGGDEPKEEILRSLMWSDSLLEAEGIHDEQPKRASQALLRVNQFRATLEAGYYYWPDPQIARLITRNGQRSARWVKYLAEKQPSWFNNPQQFGLALENSLNLKTLSSSEMKALLNTLSPFENRQQSSWMKQNFGKDNMLVRGSLDYGFNFGGLYQFLAYLYGATGSADRSLQCVDTLLRYSQNNFQANYANGIDNATNIAAVFYIHDNQKALEEFVKGYVQKRRITVSEFYEQVIARTIISSATASTIHLYFFGDANSNLNLQYARRSLLSFFFNQYRESLKQIASRDEQFFKTALAYKNEGIQKSLNREPLSEGELTVEQNFDKAFEYYRQVSPTYLKEIKPIIGVSAADEIVVPRSYLFAYPDLKWPVHPLEPRSFHFFYSGPAFIKYIIGHGLFESLYPTDAELGWFTDWFRDYNSEMFAPRYFMSERLPYDVMAMIDNEISKKGTKADLNWLYLYIGEAAQFKKDSIMVNYYRKLRPDILTSSMRSKEFGNNINNQTFRLIGHAVEGFARYSKWGDVKHLMTAFRKPLNRSTLYAYAAAELQRDGVKGQVIQQLIDSSYAELDRVPKGIEGQPNRQVLAYALMMQDPEKRLEETRNLIKNLGAKFIALQRMVRSQGYHQHLYDAVNNMPEFLSSGDEAIFLANIQIGYQERAVNSQERWKTYEQYYIGNNDRWINYVDESN